MKTKNDHQRLTKQWLESLPEGTFLASGIVAPPDGLGARPALAERLGPIKDRGNVWKRAVAVKASGKRCHAFETESDFKEFLQMYGRLETRWPSEALN